MQLLIDRRGQVRCLYGETIDLTVLGELSVRRASHVEPDEAGRWWADLSPVGGPKLGPFGRRSQALEEERLWLETHWLDAGDHQPALRFVDLANEEEGCQNERAVHR